MPLLILAGLILLIAGKSWFAGAATVGWICLAAGLAPLVIALVLLILGALGVGTAAVISKKRGSRLRRGF